MPEKKILKIEKSIKLKIFSRTIYGPLASNMAWRFKPSKITGQIMCKKPFFGSNINKIDT